MSTKFIVPVTRHPRIAYCPDTQNNPVNIKRCREIIKKQWANGYGNSYPVIVFVFSAKESITWYYDNEVKRDKQYDEILNPTTVLTIDSNAIKVIPRETLDELKKELK